MEEIIIISFKIETDKHYHRKRLQILQPFVLIRTFQI
jgi:hypothetical protein